MIRIISVEYVLNYSKFLQHECSNESKTDYNGELIKRLPKYWVGPQPTGPGSRFLKNLGFWATPKISFSSVGIRAGKGFVREERRMRTEGERGTTMLKLESLCRWGNRRWEDLQQPRGCQKTDCGGLGEVSCNRGGCYCGGWLHWRNAVVKITKDKEKHMTRRS